MLLPSLVLYDQPHPQGEEIMLQHDKDLARRPDCLIILGTTMKVIGIKKMVKEYIKTVKEEHARQQAKEDERKRAPQFGAHRRVPVIFVNKTRPDKEWENLVDVWVEGECDMFADGVERSWKKERPADWQIQGTLVDDAFGFGTKKRMVGEGRKGDSKSAS
jgi:NAD-dependent histone deacetylase SIR2